MADSYNKKEREKKKAQRRKEKQLKKEAKKEAGSSRSLDDMMAYVDENGIIRDTPPDPTKKKEVKAKSIELGVPSREKEEFDPVMNGVISFFDTSKGFGFIIAENDEKIFVHQSNITGEPSERAKVQFEKEKGPKGWVAVRVKVI